MSFLFDFGLSQEDAAVEIAGLDLQDGDRLLCIASAGEVPLNILAEKNITIRAVDISLPQIYLAKLKLVASLILEPGEAASFLGFTAPKKEKRLALLQKTADLMSAEERLFWQAHSEVIEKGVISTGRFERYVSSFSRLALHLLGKKQILGLMELNTVSEQEKFFDERINLKMLRKLFAFIFRPSRYRNRAISEQGLQNAGTESKADFYFSRFRKFCTATPARNNYYLQYFLFNKILYQEALPGYLTEKGMERIRRNRNKIEFINASFRDSIVQNPRTPYNKFHLSNISDWMNPGEFESLLETIDGTSERPFRMLSRHLHHAVSIPGALRNKMVADSRMKDLLLENDKFPFYNVLPISSR